MINKGQFVDAGMALYKIADLSTIWVIADVYEYELPLIRLRQTARVRLSYLPVKSLPPKSTTIRHSRRIADARVRLVMPNPGGIYAPDVHQHRNHHRLGKRLAVPMRP
jgi:Cu(I)/Ag(I) efflux system membrane fusion protein